MSAELPEGVPMEQGWEMGAEVHVQDKKLVDKERVWAKGRVVGVEGARACPCCVLFFSSTHPHLRAPPR